MISKVLIRFLSVIFTLAALTALFPAFFFDPLWKARVLLTELGHWFGLVGLLFAVPLMVVAKVAWHALLADYRASEWFMRG